MAEDDISEIPSGNTPTGTSNANSSPTRPITHFAKKPIADDGPSPIAPSREQSRTSMRKRSERKRPTEDSDIEKKKLVKKVINFGNIEEKLPGGGGVREARAGDYSERVEGVGDSVERSLAAVIKLETKKRKSEQDGSGQEKRKKPTLLR
jgi:hypothetical protein